MPGPDRDGQPEPLSPDSLPTVTSDSLAPGGPPAEVRATAPPFGAGDLLSGRYRVTAWLAHGGMGEVYEAYDLELGVPVALKTIRPAIANLPGALGRFKREVLLARSVAHPNVCRIYHLGWDEDAQSRLGCRWRLDPSVTLSAQWTHEFERYARNLGDDHYREDTFLMQLRFRF